MRDRSSAGCPSRGLASTVLFLYVIVVAGCRAPAEWSEFHRHWAEALTYGDDEWSATDFGETPGSGDEDLLRRYLPRISICEGSLYPIDFYRDYLPESVLVSEGNGVVLDPVDRDSLKRYERTPGHHLVYRGEHRTQPPEGYEATLYGRVFRETMRPLPGWPEGREYIVLKYSAVFSASGLPADLSATKRWGARLVGDPSVWHQLDIHGAIHVLVSVETQQPEILLLAQHNHFRSYVIGVDVPRPPDGRVSVAYAERSNEPYPTPRAATRRWRCVGNPMKFRYLVSGKGGGLGSGVDVVHGLEGRGRKVDARLAVLPDRDPLYGSWIDLGDRLRILGIFPSFFRAGPPGMDLNTVPGLSRYTDLACFWYFQEGDDAAVPLFDQAFTRWPEVTPGPLLEHHAVRLGEHLARVASARGPGDVTASP